MSIIILIISSSKDKGKKMEQFLSGNWKAGWAMDLHTISCTKNSDGSFNTVRSEIGDLVYKLKYQQNNTVVNHIAKKVSNFLQTRRIFSNIDVILPVPPSKQRNLQPVTTIALIAGNLLNKKVDTNYIVKYRSTSEIKEIMNPNDRAIALDGVFGVIDERYKGKNILLFDDLFRSGTTLKEITKILYSTGKVNSVYVVTMTKTRVNK